MTTLPPYAKRARVVHDALWIRCGQRGWDHLRANPECGEIVWPATEPPNAHDWSFVRGFHCYVVAGDVVTQSVYWLVTELLAQGAPSVDVIDWNLFNFGKRAAVSFHA